MMALQEMSIHPAEHMNICRPTVYVARTLDKRLNEHLQQTTSAVIKSVDSQTNIEDIHIWHHREGLSSPLIHNLLIHEQNVMLMPYGKNQPPLIIFTDCGNTRRVNAN